MTRQLLRWLLVLTCVSALIALTPLSAGAQSEITITVGATGTLQSRVVARVPVEITCAPTEIFFGDTGGNIMQAAGRQIAHGDGGVDLTSIVCDGTPHPTSFVYTADFDSPPFHGGNAVITALVSLCDVNFVCQRGESGLQTVKLAPSR
jgi:hypothetical protein